MADYDDFIAALEQGIKELAKQTVSDFKDQAVSDAKSFLDTSKGDLKKWVKQLADGELTKDDFEWLIKGREDAIELLELKQAGLAVVQADKFKKSLATLVVDTAFDVFL